MHARFDQLGKNVLRDFFVLFGRAQAEEEVPTTDAQRIDLWCVPDPACEHLRLEAASGLVLQIASAPAMLDLFIQALGDRAFHDSLRKRYQWRQVLEQRDNKPWPLPAVWKVALPWLVRLRFEVPKDPLEQSNEEREFVMETQEWFERYQQQLRDEGQKLGLDEGRARTLGRLLERRLGRPLGEAECKVLTERIARLGEDRVGEVLLEFGAEALSAWLADPTAR